MKKGDLVTVALRWKHTAGGQLSRTEIHHTGLMGFMANDDDRNVHYLVDEGITWVHGHVADDSPEGKALIAAHALAPKPDDPFAGGVPYTSSVFGNGTFGQPSAKNELGE